MPRGVRVRGEEGGRTSVSDCISEQLNSEEREGGNSYGPRSQRRDGRAAPSDGFRALHLAVEAGSLQIVLDLCRQLAL